jgi:CubicO group peptidase (beta-lactamase class C family)
VIARAIAVAACAALCACAHNAMAPQRPFEPVLDRELAAIAADAQCPLASLSVVAVRDGEVVYERAFGRRFIDPAGRADKPADPGTLYRIASISKLVTTLGVMKLVEAHRLSLDEDIGTYLGYRVRNPAFPGTPITLRMLLTHTSSLRDDAGYYSVEGDLKDFLVPGGARFGEGKMWARDHAPGTYFSYANLPWGVAGTVMEKVTGKRFDRLMREIVIDPLGLTGGYNPAELPRHSLANLATLYRKATAGDENVWNPQGPWIAQTDDYSDKGPVSRARDDYVIGSNGTLFGPQGGMRASTRDLARIMRMLMNGGEIDGRRVLERSTVDAMLSRQWTRGAGNGEPDYGSHRGRFNAWGLGNQQFLDVSGPDFGDRLVEGGGFLAAGHLGDAYGLLGTLAFDRASRDGFAFLIGGTGCNPETQRGAFSAGARFEERIATALHRRAIEGKSD